MNHYRRSHHQTAVNASALGNSEEALLLNVGNGQADFVDMGIEDQMRTALFLLHDLTNQAFVYGAAASAQPLAELFCRLQCLFLSAGHAGDLTQGLEHLYCLHKNTPSFFCGYPACISGQHPTSLFSPVGTLLTLRKFYSITTAGIFHFLLQNPLKFAIMKKNMPVPFGAALFFRKGG